MEEDGIRHQCHCWAYPTLERARKAASLVGLSLADYATSVLRKASDRDIIREARKLTRASEAEGGGR